MLYVRAGYSFVAPSILFTESNAGVGIGVGRDGMRRAPGELGVVVGAGVGVGGKHVEEAGSGVGVGVSAFFKKYTMNLKDNYLGNGSFSICRRCQDRRTKKYYAVKIISKLHDASLEVNMLRRCQGACRAHAHPHPHHPSRSHSRSRSPLPSIAAHSVQAYLPDGHCPRLCVTFFH